MHLVVLFILARTDFMEKAGTGIKRVKNACNDNGNEVNFHFTDAFWITIHSNKNVPGKVVDKLTDNQKNIIALIKRNPDISARQLAPQVGISHRKIQENIAKLKEYGILERIGPAKGGHWKIIKNNKL
jgi:predicted HTH transcriptional regulator